MLDAIVSYFLDLAAEMVGLDDSFATVSLSHRVCIYYQSDPHKHKQISQRKHCMVAQLIFKFYKLMRSNRSNQKQGRRSCVFAVHPISITFSKQYRHNYILYFERNLHIFSRYQLNERMIVKDKRFYFQMPTTIQSHAINSPQQLQFKWSLYEEKLVDNYTQEEFMESKKANLKWCWQIYQRNQIEVHSAEVAFGFIKVRITYLFVISNCNQHIVDAIAVFYKQNNIVPTKLKKKLSKLSPNNNSEEILYSETHSIEGIIKDQSKFGASNNYISTPIEQSSIGESLKRKFESPSFFEGEDSQALKQTKKQQSNGLIKIQRSISDLKEYVNNKRLAENQDERLIKSLSIAGERDENGQARRGPFRSQTINYFQVKAITASQYFNEEGKLIITPFYSQLKYWLVIFAVLFIFIWVVDQGPKPHTHPSHNNSPHHKSKQLHAELQRPAKPSKKKLKSTYQQQQVQSQQSSRQKDKKASIQKQANVQNNSKRGNQSKKSIKKVNKKMSSNNYSGK